MSETGFPPYPPPTPQTAQQAALDALERHLRAISGCAVALYENAEALLPLIAGLKRGLPYAQPAAAPPAPDDGVVTPMTRKVLMQRSRANGGTDA